MKDEKKTEHTVQRREVIKGAAAAGLIAASGSYPLAFAAQSKTTSNDLIRRENAKPGTRDWLLTKTHTTPGMINKNLVNGRSEVIEGYCSANSIRAGEKLQIMVSTNPESKFKLEIFRTGFYGGTGARLVKTFESIQGATQPDPDIGENYVRECQWEPTVEFEIPEDWLSGVYLGKLTAKASGIQSYVIFIVRDDRPCDLLFQCSDLTWSAYNRWPMDYSIYTEHKDWKSTGVPSGTVSFDRPYGLFTHPVNKIKKSGGSGEYLPWEFPLAFWMEQYGYDVSYISNVDTHADPKGLLRTKGFISVGHDEYWSLEMYENAMKARDAGVSLAFFGGNSVLCVVPMLPSGNGKPNRNIRREGWFMPIPENIPEAAKQRLFKKVLNEQTFELNMGPDGALLMGGRLDKDQETGRGMGVGDWTCAMPEHWLFESTGMKKGDSVKGLLGWEWHGAPAMDLPGMNVVAEGDATINGKKVGRYSSTLYDGPQDNVVFNAATIWWANGISSPPGHVNPSRHGVRQQGPDKRVQQITRNLFERMIG
ncbi:hypothetical protein OAL44_01140 [Planctomycetaceae bacterium]|nr:hypothetical protein [Planctomycetaceae bacterium]MDC0307718.1 hypothetical protein [Planctomycetaceae bacterium]